MGSEVTEVGHSEQTRTPHLVTLSNNYYIAVFETTQEQWAHVQTAVNDDQPNFTTDRAMRPMEKVSYNEIRNAANSQTANPDYDYPKNPNPGSFLGLLRAKTGLAFDLPSEAQWEFACRAGHGTGSWGDGKPIRSSGNDENLTRLGRFQYNGGKVGGSFNPPSTCEVTNGTAIVGSYAPNSWGLYDMHGNVWEWCLDWYAVDITGLGGAVNTTAGSTRVLRGGSWGFAACYCRAARRFGDYEPTARNFHFGFRLALPASPAEVSK